MPPTLHRLSDRGPTVLLFPQFATDTRAWGNFAQRLASRFGIVAVDWPTSWLSPVPGKRPDLIEEAKLAVSSVDDTQAVIAAGHSAAAAVELAHQGVAQAVALLGAPPEGGTFPEVSIDKDAAVEQVLATYYEPIAEAIQVTDENERRAAMASAMLGTLEDQVPADELNPLRGMFQDAADVLLAPEAQPVKHDTPWEDRLYNMEAPLLILAPSEAELASQSAAAAAARAPRGRVAYLDTHHGEFMWLAQPEQAANAISEFLRESLPGA